MSQDGRTETTDRPPHARQNRFLPILVQNIRSENGNAWVGLDRFFFARKGVMPVVRLLTKVL